MNITKYFEQLKTSISLNPYVFSWEYHEDARTLDEGFFKARLHFIDGSLLEFREYVSIRGFRPVKYTYSYHYQKDHLIFRYDNTPPPSSTFHLSPS